MAAAAFMAADLLYFHHTREMSRNDLVLVTGTVERAVYAPAPDRGWSRSTPEPHVDVWLAGREHPFRFIGAAWQSLATLPHGAPMTLGMDPDAMKKPLKPGFLFPAPFYRPLTVQLQNGWWDVRLNYENRVARSNLWIMPWLSPLLALLGFLLSTRRCIDWMAAHSSRRYAPTRKPLKGRLSLRLLKDDSRK